MKNEIEKIFVTRDGMTKREAKETCSSIREELYDLIGKGGGYADVEYALSDYGLEMDYIFDLLI